MADVVIGPTGLGSRPLQFCWVHFGDHVFEDDPETQFEGWVSWDGTHWVCGSCFEDFRERFDFQVETPAA